MKSINFKWDKEEKTCEEGWSQKRGERRV